MVVPFNPYRFASLGGAGSTDGSLWNGTSDLGQLTTTAGYKTASKEITMAVEFKRPAEPTAAGVERFFSFSTGKSTIDVFLGFNSSDVLEIRCGDQTSGISLYCTGPTVSDASLHTFVMSADYSDTGKRFMYYDDSSFAATWSTYVNQALDWTTSDRQTLGAEEPNGAGRYWIESCFGHLWVEPTYYDISTESIRRNFVTAGNRSAAKNADGSTSLLVQPMYHCVDGSFTNSGYGGDFTAGDAPTACTLS